MDRWLLCRAVLLYIEMSDQWHFFKKIWGRATVLNLQSILKTAKNLPIIYFFYLKNACKTIEAQAKRSFFL